MDPVSGARSASEVATGGRPRFGQRVLRAGICTEEQLERALREQCRGRGRLGHHLARQPGVSLELLSEFLEEEIRAGRLEEPAPSADGPGLAVLPAWVAHLYNVFPVGVRDGRLELAVPPGLPGRAVDVVGEVTGLPVEPVAMPPRRLRALVERGYLAAGPAVLRPLAGLPTFVVEDEALGVKPVAAAVRTAGLSAETWLRSLLAELVSARERRLVLREPGREPALELGREARATPLPEPVGVALRELLLELAGLQPTGPGPPVGPGPGQAAAGRFLALLRGRRLACLLRADGTGAAAGPGAAAGSGRLTLHLADLRLDPDDVDELFDGAPAARAGIDAWLLGRQRGLVLVVGPDGGGVRPLTALLGARLAQARPPATWVGAHPPREARGLAVVIAEGDAEVAARVPGAGSGLVVVEELPGPRAAERSLLAAARRPVIAALPAADAEAALAWLVRQGLGGALKAGLLHAVLGVVALEPACACAGPLAAGPALARLGLALPPQPLVGNRGCGACLATEVRRSRPLLSWRPVGVPGSPPGEDEVAERRAAQAAGRPGLLGAALAACAREGADAGALLCLLRGEAP